MIELTDIQRQIQASLITAICNGNLQTVQGIFKENGYDDIQAVLSHEGTPTGEKDTILDFAIVCLKQGKIKESVEIIEQIWKVANQKARDSMCCRAIDSFQGYGVDNIPALKEIIQEMEEHRRVKGFYYELRNAIESLNVDEVKTALEDCGEDAARVLEREIYWNNGRVDAFLVYPLLVNYDRELNQEDVEKIKESFKLMFDAASPELLGFEPNGNNYVMSKLVRAQKYFAKIPGVGEQCFQDLIQEFEEKLSKDTLDNAKTDDQIAWDKAYATRFSQEINHDLFGNGEPNAFIDDIDLGQDTENSAPTADNKTPEKNDTTFWSEHKGKIALGVTGLCVAGAVAAYMLAYPAVALALTVLATVILMGAGIAKVLEDPSVEGLSTSKEQGA